MDKPLDLLVKRVSDALARGATTKAQLHRKTGISRPSLDGYLNGADPSLHNLDRIAEVLGLQAWQLIAPEGSPAAKIPADILEALARALSDPKNEEFIRRWLQITNKD